MSETRKLTAILVADVVGYSRLAGADEPWRALGHSAATSSTRTLRFIRAASPTYPSCSTIPSEWIPSPVYRTWIRLWSLGYFPAVAIPLESSTYVLRRPARNGSCR